MPTICFPDTDTPNRRRTQAAAINLALEQAGRDGEVIVIPARTNGTGPEARLLSGLNYRLGTGFAPHPLFARWMDEQVLQALGSRLSTRPAPRAASTTHHRH